MARTVVFLVREGNFGTSYADRGDYDNWIEIVKRLLQGSGVVRIVLSWREAVTEIIDDGHGMENSAVVFFTKGMFSRAQALRKDYPNLQVVVLTANPHGLSGDPSGVVVIDKNDFDQDATKEAVLA